MILLGLVLVIASGAFGGLLIAGNLDGGPTTPATVVGSGIGSYTAQEAFLAGLALALLFSAGLAVVVAGAVRARRRSVGSWTAGAATVEPSGPRPPQAPGRPDAPGEAAPVERPEQPTLHHWRRSGDGRPPAGT